MTPNTRILCMIIQTGISHRVLSLQGAALTYYLLSQSQLCPAPPSNPPAIHTSNTTGLLTSNSRDYWQLHAKERSESPFLVSPKFEGFWTQYIPLVILHPSQSKLFDHWISTYYWTKVRTKEEANQPTRKIQEKWHIMYQSDFPKTEYGFLLPFSQYKVFNTRQQKLKAWSIHIYTAVLMLLWYNF